MKDSFLRFELNTEIFVALFEPDWKTFMVQHYFSKPTTTWDLSHRKLIKIFSKIKQSKISFRKKTNQKPKIYITFKYPPYQNSLKVQKLHFASTTEVTVKNFPTTPNFIQLFVSFTSTSGMSVVQYYWEIDWQSCSMKNWSVFLTKYIVKINHCLIKNMCVYKNSLCWKKPARNRVKNVIWGLKTVKQRSC